MALKRVVAALEKSQLSDGTWARDWGGNGEKGFLYGEKTLDDITILGHQLEWMAFAGETFSPSKECIRKAVFAVVENIGNLPVITRRPFKTLLPCSHAARAMCDMRAIDPFDTWSFIVITSSTERKE